MAVRDALLALLTRDPRTASNCTAGSPRAPAGAARSTSARRTRPSNGSRSSGSSSPRARPTTDSPCTRSPPPADAAAAPGSTVRMPRAPTRGTRPIDRVLIALSLPGGRRRLDRRGGARALAACDSRRGLDGRDASHCAMRGRTSDLTRQSEPAAALVGAGGTSAGGRRAPRPRSPGCRASTRVNRDWPSHPSRRGRGAGAAPRRPGRTERRRRGPLSPRRGRSCRRPRGRAGTRPGSRRTAACPAPRAASSPRRRPRRRGLARCVHDDLVVQEVHEMRGATEHRTRATARASTVRCSRGRGTDLGESRRGAPPSSTATIRPRCPARRSSA